MAHNGRMIREELAPDVVDRYLARIGLDGSDHSLAALQAAHVRAVPFENLATQVVMARRWDDNFAHIGVVGLELLERGPGDEGPTATSIAPADYGVVLRDRFGLVLDEGEPARLVEFIAGKPSADTVS